MRRPVIRWFGGAALVVLVGLAYLQWRSDRAAAPGQLLPIAPAHVDRIVIETSGQAPQRYRRRDGHWWLTGAQARRVDQAAWLDRIAGIAAAPVQRWRPVHGMNLHALGLAPPRLSVVLNGRRVDYGVMTPFEPARYVRVGDRIAVIPAQYTPQVGAARRVTLPDTR